MPRKPKNEFLPTPEERGKLYGELERKIAETKRGLVEHTDKIRALGVFLSGEGYEELIPEKILNRAERLKGLARIGDDDSTSIALAMIEDAIEDAVYRGRGMSEIFEDIEVPLKDIILRLFSSHTLKHDDESIQLVYKNVLKRMEKKNADFLDALMSSLDEREGIAGSTRTLQGYIDESTRLAVLKPESEK